MPELSVIVPTFNRAFELQRCLEALSIQTFPPDHFEVIVVDDGGDAPLEAIIQPFGASLRIRLFTQKNAGPARARNVGASHAIGQLLAFTDDDCRPEPGWLAALHSCSLRSPESAVGGQIVNGLPDDACAAASQSLLDYLNEMYESEGSKASAFFTSNNLAVPAPLFRKIGGFNESFPLAAGEDREFCDRWQDHGYRLVRASDACIRHFHAMSLSNFWRQHLNYGRGAYRFRRARTDRAASSVGFEAFGFYAGLLASPLRTARLPRALVLVGLLGVSQAATALGFFLERRRAIREARSRRP